MVMRLLRKFKIAVVCLIIFLLVIFLPKHQDFDNKQKIEVIERSIRSIVNQDECHHPDLPLYNLEMMKFYKPTNKIDCGNEFDDWVMCEKSICFVKPEVSSVHDEVYCSYADLIRKSDYSAKYGSTTWTKEPYVLQKSDFVKVSCKASGGERWFGLVHGIRDTVQRSMPNVPVSQTYSDSYPLYNVIIFGLDSMSRNAFIRKLPKSYDYLTRVLGAVVLRGYNIIGDGTPQALVPILTGFTELELPETRKRFPNAVRVNAYPMIWNKFAKHGYVTSYNEDMPSIGTFTYRMTGFDSQPVDHYLRTFYLELENLLSYRTKYCIGNQPAHRVMLEYTRNFMAKYSDNPRFVLSFHGELSHESVNAVGAMDDDVEQWLQQLRTKGLLNNTVLIVMSDHGNRFSELRNTLQGKQEERLPFFSFTFPESFQKRFAQQYKNFVDNKDKLSTPFDVHATLAHILDLQLTDLKPPLNHQQNSFDYPEFKTNAPHRAISLLDAIPSNRSCADAYIEPHWCACLNWKALSLNDSAAYITAQKIAYSVISAINSFTVQYRDYCEEIQLKQINWAMQLKPRDDLLRFKMTKDRDGYIADLSGDTKYHEKLYQIQITALPGNSLFEASVQYNLQTSVANTAISQISRINKYGAQANCIYKRNPELRKYCYCKSTPK